MIVGGGIAGTALATLLAEAGRDVVLFERMHEPRWRACGVYSSPLTRKRLEGLGLGAAQLAMLVQPIGSMDVRSVSGAVCRFAYDPPACGLARPALDAAMLARAAQAGARVVTGGVVRHVDAAAVGSGPGRPTMSSVAVSDAAGERRWNAELVVGADGPGSLVARVFGVDRPVRRLRHAGMTVHRAGGSTDGAASASTAMMTIGRGWYCGVAPVPGDRVNIGIVMGERALRQRLAGRDDGTAGILQEVVGGLPIAGSWRDGPDADAVRVALPLAHRVTRRAGEGFVLVGDAAGFVDPLSGDGIHRALWSAEVAADSILARARGRRDALDGYERRMRSSFGPKDAVSWILQLFLARPAMLDYALRRLSGRAALGRTFGDVLADLEPARTVLRPGFLAQLLAP